MIHIDWTVYCILCVQQTADDTHRITADITKQTWKTIENWPKETQKTR